MSFLRVGLFELLDDLVELLETLEGADAVFEGLEAALLLEIAVDVPSRLEHGDVLALLRGGKLDLPHGSIHAHGKRRQGRTDAGFE